MVVGFALSSCRREVGSRKLEVVCGAVAGLGQASSVLQEVVDCVNWNCGIRGQKCKLHASIMQVCTGYLRGIMQVSREYRGGIYGVY